MDTKFFADNKDWIVKEVGRFLEENQASVDEDQDSSK